MIQLELVRRNIREGWWLWFWCALTLGALGWLHVWVTARIDADGMRDLLENFRDFEKFLPISFDELITYSGRIGQFYNEPTVLVCMLAWVIARGSDVVSGQLDRGTLEMVLAQPVSRLQIFWSHAIVTIVGALLLPLVAWCGTSAGIARCVIEEPVPGTTIILPLLDMEVRNPFVERRLVEVPLSERVTPREFFPAVTIFASLGICFAGIAMLLSSLDRFRRRTIGLVTGLFMFQFILRLAALSHSSLNWLLNFTILSVYDPNKFVIYWTNDPSLLWQLGLYDAEGRYAGLGPLGAHLLMLSIGITSMLAAAYIFKRRDLPAPV